MTAENPFDLVLSPRLMMSEKSRPREVACLIEAVVTPAAGQLELTEVVAHLAEQRLLLDVVRQVGVVRRIGRKAVVQVGGRQRHPVRRIYRVHRTGRVIRVDEVEAELREIEVADSVRISCREGLLVLAINLRIEAADQPLKRSGASRCEPHLLGVLLEIGRIARVGRRVRESRDGKRAYRVGDLPGSGLEELAGEADVNGIGQRRRIAAHQDIARRSPADAGQLGRAEVVASRRGRRSGSCR